MPAYYPVFLDLRDRRCVVIGGGELAEEKVVRLLKCGASVTIFSPDVTEGLRGQVDGDRLDWVQRKFEPGNLEGAFLAIVADTDDDDLNRLVSREAMARNVPLNVADITELCTWITPAVVRRGEVTVAISTGGASPALARKFREELSGTGRLKSRRQAMEFADLAPLLFDARKELASMGVKLYPDHWQVCLTDELLDLVQAGEMEKARETLISSLLVGVDCDCAEGVCRLWEELKRPSDQETDQVPSTTRRPRPSL